MHSQRPRVVLLGASNLAQGLEVATAAARARLGGPVEVLAACGRGRSYALESRFLTRVLPGIESSGLWAALAQRAPAETHVLATDLGNDLAFGASAARIEGWLERVLGRLAHPGVRGVLTGLPLAKLERVSPREFALWKCVFFPTRRIEREALLEEARELEERSSALARRLGFTKVALDPAWYGRDPIHYARAKRSEVWRSLVEPWGAAVGAAPPDAERSGWLWYERVRLLGIPTGRPQPCARLTDGTTFSLY